MDTRKNPLSIKDLANLSGVSIATVSRVLNNKGGYSKETEERILALAKSFGYVSNMAAKTLREARSRTIGLIVPNIINEFFSTLAYHIETCMSEQGYSVFICNSDNQTQKEKEYFRSLASKGVDGILCISGLNELTQDIIYRDIPIVCIDRLPKTNRQIPQISNDDMHIAYIATKHLLDKGCRHILLVVGYSAAYSSKGRFDGYCQALAEYGLPLDKNYILKRPGREAAQIEAEIMVYQFLASSYPVDGIFATSDSTALGALYALKRADRRVPEDIRLTGFDNMLYSRLATPPISSVERHPELLALKGCEILLNLIQGHEPQELLTIVPAEFVERESSR
ncbi:MAG: LacI family transcriptional regulator [Lachnospiraceae bacterium]|jgi:LacI family transcriptional regulator|nr:LacI family transcriptional regulator [Lachnospiraceae bacterium]